MKLHSPVIRIISVVLIAAFFAQDIAWASPDIFESTSSRSTLQVKSFFDQSQDLGSPENALRVSLEYIRRKFPNVHEIGYTIILHKGGFRNKIDFSEKHTGDVGIIVPCYVWNDVASYRGDAVIDASSGEFKLLEELKEQKTEQQKKVLKEIPLPPTKENHLVPDGAVSSRRGFLMVLLAGFVGFLFGCAERPIRFWTSFVDQVGNDTANRILNRSGVRDAYPEISRSNVSGACVGFSGVGRGVTSHVDKYLSFLKEACFPNIKFQMFTDNQANAMRIAEEANRSNKAVIILGHSNHDSGFFGKPGTGGRNDFIKELDKRNMRYLMIAFDDTWGVPHKIPENCIGVISVRTWKPLSGVEFTRSNLESDNDKTWIVRVNLDGIGHTMAPIPPSLAGNRYELDAIKLYTQVMVAAAEEVYAKNGKADGREVSVAIQNAAEKMAGVKPDILQVERSIFDIKIGDVQKTAKVVSGNKNMLPGIGTWPMISIVSALTFFAIFSIQFGLFTGVLAALGWLALFVTISTFYLSSSGAKNKARKSEKVIPKPLNEKEIEAVCLEARDYLKNELIQRSKNLSEVETKNKATFVVMMIVKALFSTNESAWNKLRSELVGDVLPLLRMDFNVKNVEQLIDEAHKLMSNVFGEALQYLDGLDKKGRSIESERIQHKLYDKLSGKQVTEQTSIDAVISSHIIRWHDLDRVTVDDIKAREITELVIYEKIGIGYIVSGGARNHIKKVTDDKTGETFYMIVGGGMPEAGPKRRGPDPEKITAAIKEAAEKALQTPVRTTMNDIAAYVGCAEHTIKRHMETDDGLETLVKNATSTEGAVSRAVEKLWVEEKRIDYNTIANLTGLSYSTVRELFFRNKNIQAKIPQLLVSRSRPEKKRSRTTAPVKGDILRGHNNSDSIPGIHDIIDRHFIVWPSDERVTVKDIEKRKITELVIDEERRSGHIVSNGVRSEIGYKADEETGEMRYVVIKSNGVTQNAPITQSTEQAPHKDKDTLWIDGVKREGRDYLTKLEDPRYVISSMLGLMVSMALEGKKVVLTFHKNIKGFECDKLRVLVYRKLLGLKGRPGFDNALKNLIILDPFGTSGELSTQLSGKDVDLSDKETKVFMFAPATEKANLATVDVNIHSVFIDEGKDFNAIIYYYPLFEIITMALLKEHGNYDAARIKDILKELGTKPEDINIDINSIQDNGAFLVISVIPKTSRLKMGDRIERYVLLKRFIDSAA